MRNAVLTGALAAALAVFTFTSNAAADPIVVNSVSPTAGAKAGGTPVTITGANLANANVSFRLNCGRCRFGATIQSNTATRIVVITPAITAGETLASIEIDTPDDFVSVDDVFTFDDKPIVGSLTPPAGLVVGGTNVVIAGENFTGATAVRFGGTAAAVFTVDNDRQITAVTPAHAAGAVDVTVTAPSGTSAVTQPFTYYAATLTALVPTSDYVTGGATVTISGTDFTGATAVSFGGVPATFTVNSSTRITATVPAHAAGRVNVVVTVPGGRTAAGAASRFSFLPLPRLTAIYKFKGGAGDGAFPTDWLVQDKDGNLFGTTNEGGAAGLGTVFMLSPPTPPGTNWTRRILHSFAGPPSDGLGPNGLFAAPDGTLYGTTNTGGAADGTGTVFRLTPPASGDRRARWRYEILYVFRNATGRALLTGVVVDKAGNVFGSASGGGPKRNGILFKLTPPGPRPPRWTLTILHAFADTPDGANPNGRILLDKDGVLTLAVDEGGRFNKGQVIQVPTSDPSAKRDVLYNFRIADGQPTPGAIPSDKAGNLYGTALGGANAQGLIFRLNPPFAPSTTWTATRLFNFSGSDGGRPRGLTMGKSGALLGVTEWGGANDLGTLYKLLPPAVGQSQWTLRTMHTFASNDPIGHTPTGQLLLGQGNILYGITRLGGGPCDCGTVFKVEE